MKQCFLCGREYDEANRGKPFELINIDSQKIVDVYNIKKGNRALALCGDCGRAFAFGMFKTIEKYYPDGTNLRFYGSDYDYE